MAYWDQVSWRYLGQGWKVRKRLARSRQSSCQAIVVLVSHCVLFSLCERETYVLGERHLANLDQGKLLVRPDLCNIEQSSAKCLGPFRLHDLDIQLPHRILATGDSIP